MLLEYFRVYLLKIFINKIIFAIKNKINCINMDVY
jgi:hypothetical protein